MAHISSSALKRVHKHLPEEEATRLLIVTRKMLKEGRGKGGTYNVRHHEAHKWYYLRDMTPEECVLVKCSDTKGGVAKMCLHTAFVDESSSKDAPRRQSIEVRCLVFDAE